jgi:hypothetical protein
MIKMNKEKQKFYYPCDYCGGKEMQNKDIDGARSNIGIYFKVEAMAGQEEIERTVCVWCWIDVFDKVLGKHEK